jgi:hypothetical protein
LWGEDGGKQVELDFAQCGTIALQVQSGWQNNPWRTGDIATAFNWPNCSTSQADSNFMGARLIWHVNVLSRVASQSTTSLVFEGELDPQTPQQVLYGKKLDAARR